MRRAIGISDDGKLVYTDVPDELADEEPVKMFHDPVTVMTTKHGWFRIETQLVGYDPKTNSFIMGQKLHVRKWDPRFWLALLRS